MAFMMPIVTQSGGTDYQYNIDYAVGTWGYNVKEDVMLIQALLRIAYYEAADSPLGRFEPPPGHDEPIAVDGICGPTTLKFIQWYQDQTRAAGHDVLADGRFDPARAYKQVSMISKTKYAIELLNNHCYHACNAMGADYYTGLPQRGDMPRPLYCALRTCKSRACQYRMY